MKNVNGILITSNFTLLMAYFFVFGHDLKLPALRWLILISFVLLCASLILLVWYHFRFPVRTKIYNDLIRKSMDEAVDGIASTSNHLLFPLVEANARAGVRKKVHDQLTNVTNQEEYNKFKKEIEEEIVQLKKELADLDKGIYKDDGYDQTDEYKSVRKIVESFIKNLQYESREHFQNSYKKPLEENHRRFKNIVDQISFSYRIHIFTSGCILIIIAIIVQTLVI